MPLRLRSSARIWGERKGRASGSYRPRSVQVGLGRDSELDYPRGISPLRDLLRAD